MVIANAIVENILTSISQALACSLLIASLMVVICLLLQRLPVSIKLWGIDLKEANLRYLFLAACIMTLLLSRTIFGKAMGTVDPLSNVLGNWGFYSDSRLDTETIENALIVMILFMIAVPTFRNSIIGNRIKIKHIISFGMKGSFLLSAVIEILEVIMRVGTFRLSDIVYSVIAGTLGSLLYLMVRSIKLALLSLRRVFSSLCSLLAVQLCFIDNLFTKVKRVIHPGVDFSLEYYLYNFPTLSLIDWRNFIFQTFAQKLAPFSAMKRQKALCQNSAQRCRAYIGGLLVIYVFTGFRNNNWDIFLPLSEIPYLGYLNYRARTEGYIVMLSFTCVLSVTAKNVLNFLIFGTENDQTKDSTCKTSRLEHFLSESFDIYLCSLCSGIAFGVSLKYVNCTNTYVIVFLTIVSVMFIVMFAWDWVQSFSTVFLSALAFKAFAGLKLQYIVALVYSAIFWIAGIEMTDSGCNNVMTAALLLSMHFIWNAVKKWRVHEWLKISAEFFMTTFLGLAIITCGVENGNLKIVIGLCVWLFFGKIYHHRKFG